MTTRARRVWLAHCVVIALTISFVASALEHGTSKLAAATLHPRSRLAQKLPSLAGDDASRNGANAPRTKTDRLGKHYLMLVNTAVAFDMDAQKMAQFDRSPYDGLAVSFWHAYDTSQIHSVQDMETQIAGWKKATKKDIWPWVYVNRMVGTNVAEDNAYSRVPYFLRFQGLDLDNKAGARADFLANWRNSLRAAKDTGAPGVVCDLEFYNSNQAYIPTELARVTGHTIADTLQLLRQLGATMADSAATEYPDATLWFLFTGFARVNWKVIDGVTYFPAATYISEGLLDEIVRKNLPLHVISGGEMGVGYCHASLAELNQQLQWRQGVYAPVLQKYPHILELAGTITLWNDRSAKRSWVAQGDCGANPAATVQDLVPYMELLFRGYRCNWIYGSGNAGYFPFQRESALPFDAAISLAQSHAYEAGLH